MTIRTALHELRSSPWSSIPTAEAAISTAPRERGGWPRRILVATSGARSSDPALLFADALADGTGARVELLTVYRPRVALPSVPGRCGGRRCERPDRNEAASLLRSVRSQRRRLLDRSTRWPLRLEVGDPARIIARHAQERDADLVVMGIGRSDPRHRQRGDITPFVAAHHITVPLYAAAPAPAPRGKPDGAVVVLPDGRLHEAAVRATLAFLADRGTLLLAVPADAERVAAVSMEVEELKRAAAEMALSNGAHGVQTHVVRIRGDMLAGVIRLVIRRDIPVVTTPIHGSPGAVRTLLPNLAPSLLLTAPCSVLVVPDASIL